MWLRASRLAWLPIPVLLAAMVVLRAADWPQSHESFYPMAALNFVLSTLVSLFIAYLIARSFLVRAAPGLLLLGCGVILWGLAAVAAAIAAGGDVNTLITVHNSCVWLSALCHLAGVSLSVRSKATLAPAGAWLPAAYAPAAGAVVLIAWAARAGWMPTFFVQGHGGTPARQVVLLLAIVMFALTALLLRATSRRPLSAFTYWYALALGLIAVGLFGVMLQASAGSVLGWVGRSAQYLGGLYMLIAAVASVRESHAWGIALETALREERDFSAAVLDTAGALVVVLDPAGRITRFNRACEQLTGYRAADVLGRDARGFLIPPDEVAGVYEARRALARGSPSVHHENHWLTRSAERRLIDWSSTALKGPSGEAGYLIAVGIDITERRRAEEALRDAHESLRAQTEELQTLNDALQVRQRELEAANENLRAQEDELSRQAEALRESEQRYRTLFEAAPDAIVVHRDGRFLDANDAALHLTGAGSFQELATHSIREFFRPEECEQALERVHRAMAGHTLPAREAVLRRLDGQEAVVEFHTAPVDFRGARAIQTIIHDVTERQRAEKALREWNATLESKVALRTSELERRARQLQKLTLELTQAEERERRRLAEILHEDLQQQIAGAKFQLNLLSGQATDDPSRQGTAAEINRILKDVIGMSRGLSHELSPAVFYGNDLAEAIDWLAGQMEAQHDLRIQVDVPREGRLQSESVTVFLFRAAREMLSNVVRHAGVQEASIRLRRMGRYVGLRVSDRGRGFDPADLKETAGFGLLSIRERVELLGGRTAIRSIKGRGTIVRIVVPDSPEKEAL